MHFEQSAIVKTPADSDSSYAAKRTRARRTWADSCVHPSFLLLVLSSLSLSLSLAI